MDENTCICCELGSSDKESLSQIGLLFKKEEGNTHPIETVLEYATKLKLEKMVKKYLRTNNIIFLHISTEIVEFH